MAAKKIYDAVATIGEYTDRQGQQKKRYVNVGSVFESDKGYLSLKIDSIPVDPEWSGWVSFFVPKEQMQPVSEHSEAKGNAFQPQGGGGIDDDIPFAQIGRGAACLSI